MLWYKAWLETRWRFIIGFVVLMFGSCALVIGYPRLMQMLPMVDEMNVTGVLAERIRETAELMRSFRGYVFAQWFRQTLVQMWTLLAILLGAGGLLAQSAGGGALFTLSLPVTRTQLMTARAGTALVELLTLAFVPSLLLPLLAPFVGERYDVVDLLGHGLCLFVAGSVFFSLTFLLSTIFNDVWRPALFALGVAMLLTFAATVFPELAGVDIYRVMSGEAVFRSRSLPWTGLIVTAAISISLLYAAIRNIARQDF